MSRGDARLIRLRAVAVEQGVYRPHLVAGICAGAISVRTPENDVVASWRIVLGGKRISPASAAEEVGARSSEGEAVLRAQGVWPRPSEDPIIAVVSMNPVKTGLASQDVRTPVTFELIAPKATDHAIVPLMPNASVSSGPTSKQVVSPLPVDIVVPAATQQRVVPHAAEDAIAPRATADDVITTKSRERVLPAEPGNHVGPLGTADVVVSGCAHDRGSDVPASHARQGRLLKEETRREEKAAKETSHQRHPRSPMAHATPRTTGRRTPSRAILHPRRTPVQSGLGPRPRVRMSRGARPFVCALVRRAHQVGLEGWRIGLEARRTRTRTATGVHATSPIPC